MTNVERGILNYTWYVDTERKFDEESKKMEANATSERAFFMAKDLYDGAKRRWESFKNTLTQDELNTVMESVR